MDPKPDYGYDTYTGTGKLKGKVSDRSRFRSGPLQCSCKMGPWKRSTTILTDMRCPQYTRRAGWLDLLLWCRMPL